MDDVRAGGEKKYSRNKPHHEHSWYWKLKNQYSHNLVTSKLAIFCLVWYGIGFSLNISLLMVIASYPQYIHILVICMSVSYIMNPFFGYLGEKWTRYYVIMSGLLIFCFASLLMQLVLILGFFIKSHETFIIGLICIIVLIDIVGGGLVSANFVQFSSSQIEHASSQQLASFARWWVFTGFVSLNIYNIIIFAVLPVIDQILVRYIILAVSFFIAVGCVTIWIFFKHKFIIEPPPKIDPLKLVYHVIKYAWKHKYPERRNAFTYTDDDSPSRLDFGKSRYGGPFTTDQVESVKSFGNVLAVLLSCTLFSFYAIVDPAEIELYYNSFNVTVSAEFPLLYSSTNFIVVLMIPLLQLIVVPFFPCLIPTILKRIWFGLFLMSFSFLVATISYPLVRSTATFSYILLGISVVNNLGSALIIFSSLEFILAQAPCQMQGLLIGIWTIQFENVNIIVSIIFGNAIFVVYCFPTVLLFLSLVVYSLFIYCYKYRLRNEPSDINVRRRVEEVFERDFQRENLELAEDNEDDLSVHSTAVSKL